MPEKGNRLSVISVAVFDKSLHFTLAFLVFESHSFHLLLFGVLLVSWGAPISFLFFTQFCRAHTMWNFSSLARKCCQAWWSTYALNTNMLLSGIDAIAKISISVAQMVFSNIFEFVTCSSVIANLQNVFSCVEAGSKKLTVSWLNFFVVVLTSYKH